MTPRQARLFLAFSMFVMGACGIIYEYVLSVLGNYLIGSSHEEIFIIIGLMMFAMGTGSLVQRRMRKHLVDKFLGIEITLGLVGGVAASCVYHIFSISESYRICLYGFAFLIGLLIGMEIPVLIRINRQYSASLRTNLSEILSMDYAGSLAGALIFTFALLSHVSLARIAYILGLTNIAVAFAGIYIMRRELHRKGAITIYAIVALIALTLGLIYANRWTQWAEQRYFKDPIVYRETSPYQHIVVTQRGQRTNLYLNGHLQFSSVDEAIYHECLVHPPMTLAPSRERVLILGGGDGLALREVLRYDDVKSVTLVDIDPAVVQLASTLPELVHLNEGSLDDARVLTPTLEHSTNIRSTISIRSERGTQILQGRVHPVAQVDVVHMDADLFLRAAPGLFDVVIVDFPDPGQIELAKLYSRDFYLGLRRKLKPNALVSTQSTSPFHAKKAFLCIGETIRSAGYDVLPYHQNVPTFGEWGYHLSTPTPTADAAPREGPSLLKQMRTLKSFPVTTSFLTPEVLAATTVFGKGALTTEATIVANSKMNPVLLDYYKESWTTY